MTATFGKLEGETLDLNGALNVLCAPNEYAPKMIQKRKESASF